MNDLQTIEAPAQQPSTSALMFSPAHLQAMVTFADMMAKSSVTVPDHLKGKPADCLAIAMQATQWGMNPYAVAQKTHIVSGRLGYEAQLVNAVVQQSGAIVGAFHYEYQGTGEAIECRVGAVLRGQEAITWGEWLKNKDVTTRNSPLWKVNPKQQLGYLQVKNWARLYAPGAILGVYTPDELETMAPPPSNKHMGAADVVQPPAPALAPQLLADAQAAADKGRDAFAVWWKAAAPADRRALADHVGDLKERTERADAAAKAAAAPPPEPEKPADPWVAELEAAEEVQP